MAPCILYCVGMEFANKLWLGRNVKSQSFLHEIHIEGILGAAACSRHEVERRKGTRGNLDIAFQRAHNTT